VKSGIDRRYWKFIKSSEYKPEKRIGV